MTLEILTHDALTPCRHGFFTRRGGASSGVFQGLNCGFGSTDQKEIVRINRARVAAAMGVPDDRLIHLDQVHSARAVIAQPGRSPEADAHVTDRPGVVLSILTADCMPILFADPEAGIVGAAHAGWRGALGGVIEATLDAMVRLGARTERIAAVIGPAIGPEAYEVGPDLHDAVTTGDREAERRFRSGRTGRFMFDLPGYGRDRLRRAGVASAHWIGQCTYADAARFYSYRRSTHRMEADYGRLISTIQTS